MAENPAENREEFQREVDALKQDIRKLREDFSQMIRTLGDYSKEKVTEGRTRVREAATDAGTRAQEQFHRTSEAVRDQGEEMIEQCRLRIQERPFTCTGIAFIAGMIFSCMMRRGNE